MTARICHLTLSMPNPSQISEGKVGVGSSKQTKGQQLAIEISVNYL